MYDKHKSNDFIMDLCRSDHLNPVIRFFGVIMNQPTELTLEQQFSIHSFATQVQHMSHEQAQDFLVKLYEQMVVREATYKELLKHQWGLDAGSSWA